MNPYLKAAYLGDYLFQKYPKDASSDDVFIIKEDGKCFELYGRVDYIRGEIIAKRPCLTIDRKPPFVTAYNIRMDLKDKISLDLETMKKEKAVDIKLQPNYIALNDEHRPKCLEYIIFELLGASSPHPYIADRTEYMISKFADWITLDDMAKIRAGNIGFVDDRIKKIFESDNYILYHIIAKEALEEAKEMIKTGALTERQKHLQNIIKKIKDCGASKFTVETVSGEKLSCRNKIYTDGTMFLSGPAVTNHIDFEIVEKITYSGKVIYRKGVF